MNNSSNSNRGYASGLAKDLDAALDRLHASYKVKPPMNKKPAQQSKPTSAVDQPDMKSDTPHITVAKTSEPKKKPPVVKPEEKLIVAATAPVKPQVAFDSKLKNEVLALLVTNKLNVAEMTDSKITFEFNGKKLAITIA